MVAKQHRFAFKRLDVYQAAVEHFDWTCRVVERMPKGPFRVVNQAVGASLSVMGNIGEAYGREARPGEIEQHYRYAQGSAFEAATHLDALSALRVIDDDEYNAGEVRLSRIAMMLTRLMQKQRRRRKELRTAARHQRSTDAAGEGAAHQECGSPRRRGSPRGKRAVSDPREARPAGLAEAGRFDSPPGAAARAKRAPATESPRSGAAEGGSNPDGRPRQ